MPDNYPDDMAPLEGPTDELQTPSADPSGTATDELTAALEEKQSLQDRLLRTAAEFDNYRKRVDRERRELTDYAATDVLYDLLPIVDDFERALEAKPDADAENYRQGVDLILKQMHDLLRKRGVTQIEALGTDFDPNFHQAVMHDASAEHREGEVMQELRRGYMLRDRLLRAAMVKVAKAS
jgi:molecular chaperone GrpE